MAVHVRITLYDPAHAPLLVTSTEVSVNELPQASVAVATANTGVEGQLIVVGAGRVYGTIRVHAARAAIRRNSLRSPAVGDKTPERKDPNAANAARSLAISLASQDKYDVP